jgi:sulfoxide reductase heme-binding subunit YedZ
MTKGPHELGGDSNARNLNYQQVHQAVSAALRSKWAKTVVLALCVVPAVMLLREASERSFSANAIELVTRQSGDWTIGFLILALAITPLRRFLNLPDLIRFRRTLGLFAFFYGCLHLGAWRAFKLDRLSDAAFNVWGLRIGFIGLAVMLPLAITSTDSWIRWLGGKRWRALHTLAYLSAFAGLVHYWLLPNTGIWKPLSYSAIVALLLLLRIWSTAIRPRISQRKSNTAASQEHDRGTMSA